MVELKAISGGLRQIVQRVIQSIYGRIERQLHDELSKLDWQIQSIYGRIESRMSPGSS